MIEETKLDGAIEADSQASAPLTEEPSAQAARIKRRSKRPKSRAERVVSTADVSKLSVEVEAAFAKV